MNQAIESNTIEKLIQDSKDSRTCREFSKYNINCPICASKLKGGSLKKHLISHQKKYTKKISTLSVNQDIASNLIPFSNNREKTFVTFEPKQKVVDERIDENHKNENNQTKIKGFMIKEKKVISNIKKNDLLRELALNIQRFEYYFLVIEKNPFIFDKSLDLDDEKQCDYKFKHYFSMLNANDNILDKKRKNKKNENFKEFPSNKLNKEPRKLIGEKRNFN